MGRDRKGLFIWEERHPRRICLELTRGVFDTTLTADCRGTDGYPVPPWTAICQVDCWGDEYLTPDGLPDGDLPHRSFEWRSAMDSLHAGLDGKPLTNPWHDDVVDENRHEFPTYPEDDFCKGFGKAVTKLRKMGPPPEATVPDVETVPEEDALYWEGIDQLAQDCELTLSSRRFSVDDASHADSPDEDNCPPKFRPSSAFWRSGRTRKEKRITGKGSASHGRRGNDRYKRPLLLRRARRMSASA